MIEQAVFQQFLSLVENLSGMSPPVSHQNHIRRELGKLQERYEMDAADLLAAIPDREDIRQEFLNSVTINETYFFREQRHFDFLRDTVFPMLVAERRRLQLWSVSCSTGEEAVSLAVLALDHGLQFVVLASDINMDVLQQLRSGRFSQRSFRQDGQDYHEMLKGRGRLVGDVATGYFELDQAVMGQLHIFGINVSADEYQPQQGEQFPTKVDVIFFRNTLLYMAMDKRPAIIDALVQRLNPGGWLFLSSAEVPFVEHPQLEIIEHGGLYCFRKRHHAPATTAPRAQTAADKSAAASAAAPSDKGTLAAPAPPAQYSQNESRAKQISMVLEAIHTGRVEEAENHLEKLSTDGLESYIESFLLGQLYRAREQASAAARQFALSFRRNPQFWPGRFYYALCIKENEPQIALDEFRTAAAGSSQGDFAFLLDGFDAGLFGQISRDWIEKLEKSGRPRR